MEIIEIDSFIKYFEHIRERTMNVLRVIPSNKINWRPKKHTMSFADIIRHLAMSERYLFVAVAKFDMNLYPDFEEKEAKNSQEVIDILIKSHEDSIIILRTIDGNELHKKIRVPGGAEITMWKWLRAMVEHEVHHRGMIYAYLTILNIETPPLFGLEDSEVRRVKSS